VPPRDWYGMACLLIRDVVRSVTCSDEWEFGIVTHPGSHGARGVVVPRLPRETLALLWYYDYVTPHVSKPHDYVNHMFKKP
jgi:hypothetical protein